MIADEFGCVFSRDVSSLLWQFLVLATSSHFLPYFIHSGVRIEDVLVVDSSQLGHRYLSTSYRTGRLHTQTIIAYKYTNVLCKLLIKYDPQWMRSKKPCKDDLCCVHRFHIQRHYNIQCTTGQSTVSGRTYSRYTQAIRTQAFYTRTPPPILQK